MRGDTKQHIKVIGLSDTSTLPRVIQHGSVLGVTRDDGDPLRRNKQTDSAPAKDDFLVPDFHFGSGSGVQGPNATSLEDIVSPILCRKLPCIGPAFQGMETTPSSQGNGNGARPKISGNNMESFNIVGHTSSDQAQGSAGIFGSPSASSVKHQGLGGSPAHLPTLAPAAENYDSRVDLNQMFNSAADAAAEDGELPPHDDDAHSSAYDEEDSFVKDSQSLTSSHCCTTHGSTMLLVKGSTTLPPSSRLKPNGKRVALRQTGEGTLLDSGDYNAFKPSMETLRVGRRASLTSLKMREVEGEELGVPDDMPMDATVMARMMMRETQRRQTKKDAPSIYSVMLPCFDEKSGKIGDGCSFPSSLSVSEAIEKVLELERGEQRVRTSSVGITNFINNFPESHEIIYLFFWYIVAHARRASAERIVADRYLNLEHVFRTIFPRYISELPPLRVIEQIVTKRLKDACRGADVDQEAAGAKAIVLDDIIALLSAPEPLRDNEDNTNPLHMFQSTKGATEGRANATNGGNKFHPTLDPSNLCLLGRGTESSEAPADDAARSPLHNNSKVMTLRLANAVDTFTVAHVEVCELRNLAERCFHRLAMLFGEAFERLQSEKDTVFSAYTIIVPHVTYYTLVHSFPNDFFAGLFNAVMRVNIYRIFYYWCSGLVATYVRSTGWPTPRQRKAVTVSSGDHHRHHHALGGEGDSQRLPPVGRRRRSFETEVNASNSVVPTSLHGGSNVDIHSSAGITSGDDEQLDFVGDDSFDDVDVEVVNGYHRIVLEFKKYAKHVNFLVQKLEQRTTTMHDRLTEAPKQENSESVYTKKCAKSACFNDGNADASPGGNKVVRFGQVTGNESHSEETKVKATPKGKQKLVSVSTKHNTSEGNDFLPHLLPNIKSKVAAEASSCEGKEDNGGATTEGKGYGGNSDAAVRECVICDFPLDAANPRVKNYFDSHASEPTVCVPLPPLNGTLEEKPPFSLGQRSESSAVGILPATITTTSRGTRDRTVKVPLPSSSPLFLHYARHRLHPSVVSTLEGVNASRGKLSPQPTPRSPGSWGQFPNIHHSNGYGNSDGKARKIGFPAISKHPVDGPSSGTITPRYAEHGDTVKRTPVSLVESARKPISMTLIPVSDTHPRPLQFEGLTKEIRKRQMQFDQQMVFLQEREQQQRQEYNKNSQRGLHLAHQLLSGIYPEVADAELGRHGKGRRKRNVLPVPRK